MRDVAGEAERAAAAAAHRHFEVGSRHQFHHEVGNRGVIRPGRWLLAGVDGGHDIGMVQLTDRAGFLEERASARGLWSGVGCRALIATGVRSCRCSPR